MFRIRRTNLKGIIFTFQFIFEFSFLHKKNVHLFVYVFDYPSPFLMAWLRRPPMPHGTELESC